MTDEVAILEALAADVSAGSIPGVKAGVYPGDRVVEASQCPALVFWSGSDTDTIIRPSSGSGGSMWLSELRVQLLASPLEGDTPQEIKTGDDLVTTIIDYFNRPIREWGDVLPRGIDSIWAGRKRGALNLGYAGHNYYGAEIFLSIKFHRSRRV